MKKVICQSAEGKIRLIEETLSDSSKVYNIEIGTSTDYEETGCLDRQHAIKAYETIMLALEKSTQL